MLDKVLQLDDLWMRICYNLGATKEEAEDIVQDMYLKMQVDIDIEKIRYGQNDINRRYIYRMLHNAFIDLKRDKLLNNSVELNEELGLTERADYEYARDEAIEHIMQDIKDDIAKERRSLQMLFEIYYRVPIHSNSVYRGDKLSYRDIAKKANISLSTVFNDMKELKGIIGRRGEDIEDFFNGDYDRL